MSGDDVGGCGDAADEEGELLASGSRQWDLWGINLYPDQSLDQWAEFDSMINLRPSFGTSPEGWMIPRSATRSSP